MSSHHKEEIWSLNRQLMACHLSDGKSATFITLCSTARKRNTELAEPEESGKEGRIRFLTALLQGHLLEPVPRVMAERSLSPRTQLGTARSRTRGAAGGSKNWAVLVGAPCPAPFCPKTPGAEVRASAASTQGAASSWGSLLASIFLPAGNRNALRYNFHTIQSSS